MIVVVNPGVEILYDLGGCLEGAVESQAQINLHGNLVAIDKGVPIEAQLLGGLQTHAVHQAADCLGGLGANLLGGFLTGELNAKGLTDNGYLTGHNVCTGIHQLRADPDAVHAVGSVESIGDAIGHVVTQMAVSVCKGNACPVGSQTQLIAGLGVLAITDSDTWRSFRWLPLQEARSGGFCP